MQQCYVVFNLKILLDIVSLEPLSGCYNETNGGLCSTISLVGTSYNGTISNLLSPNSVKVSYTTVPF